MSRKTIIVIFSLVSSLAVFTTTFTVLQSLNPAATIAAITVAVIGIVWFKKTNN